MSMWINPAAIMIIGALFIPLFKGKARQIYTLIVPITTFVAVIYTKVHHGHGTYGVMEFLGQEIVFGRVDGLSWVFAFIFSLMAIIATVYGLHVKEAGHNVAAFVYAGSAIGVSFVGDFLTLFVFWEFMAFGSVFLVLYRKTTDAYKAAYRYVLVHAVGGVLVLGGVILKYMATGSFAFDLMDSAVIGMLPFTMILIGFLVNAAVPPFGAWLPDAYPQATITGAIFMASFTTKSAVYVLARGFAGTEILIPLGVVMSVWGVVYAVLENDIRRLLAYHIISQVGYMVAAVGLGTQLAINGAAAHAFAHILYKGLLFMGAGSVLYMTGKSKLTELGGLYKTMPKTFLLYMIGGFAISSVPLFSGFVSKSMILSAAAELYDNTHQAGYAWAWIILTFSSAGTFLHTGLKLPYFTFMAEDRKITLKDSDKPATDPPLNMIIGMAMAAFMCTLVGVYPTFLYDMLPNQSIGHYHPYTVEHVVFTLEILLLTWFGFYLYIKKLGGQATVSIDTDWFYRKGSKFFMSFAWNVAAKVDGIVSNTYKTLILKSSVDTAKECWKFDAGVVDGVVNGVGRTILKLGEKLRTLQTGNLQNYATAVIIGLFILVNIILIFF